MNGTTYSDGGEQPDEQIYARGVPATGLQAAIRNDDEDEDEEEED